MHAWNDVINCILLFVFQIVMSDINLRMWDESADDVNSPTSDLLVQSCESGQSARRKRRSVSARASSILPTANITIDLPLSNLQSIMVNTTTDDRYGMLYHHFNISEFNPVPVQLSLKSMMPQQLSMYTRLSHSPSPGDHHWLIMSNAHAENWSSLYIPASNLIGSNGSLWIGIGASSRNWYFWGNVPIFKTCIYSHFSKGVVKCLGSQTCDNITSVNETLTYELLKSDVRCQYWDEELQIWTTRNCEVTDIY